MSLGRIIAIQLSVGAVLALMVAPANAAPLSDPMYTVSFTDTNLDTANLILQTLSPISPGGTSVTSITGTFNGHSVAEAAVFGADQLIFSTDPFVDYNGLGFVDLFTSAPFNLYFTNPSRSGAGQLGLCYVSGCNTVSGFYPLTTFSFSQNPVPEPTTLALFGAGLAGLGAMRRRKARKST